MSDAERLKLEGSIQALRLVVAGLLWDRAQDDGVKLDRLHEELCRRVENVRRDGTDTRAHAATDALIAATLSELDMVFFIASGPPASPGPGE